MRKKVKNRTVHGFWLDNPVLHLMCPECARWMEYHDYKDTIPYADSFKGKITCIHCKSEFLGEIC